MILLSIDSSTKKTGIAFWEDGKLIDYTLIDLSSIREMDERICQMMKDVSDIISKHSPDIVVVENVNVTRNANVFRSLSKLLGAICFECLVCDADYIEINPAQWRKYAKDPGEKIGRKRDELKEWSQKKVFDLYGIQVQDDLADAILIGLAYFNMERKD